MEKEIFSHIFNIVLVLHDGESLLATHKWKLKDTCVDYVLSFYIYVGSRESNQVVRIMWQIPTEPYGWPRTGSFLYGRIDMTRNRPIWANQLLRDCFPWIDLREEKEELVIACLWRRVRQSSGAAMQVFLYYLEFNKKSWANNHTNLL